MATPQVVMVVLQPALLKAVVMERDKPAWVKPAMMETAITPTAAKMTVLDPAAEMALHKALVNPVMMEIQTITTDAHLHAP